MTDDPKDDKSNVEFLPQRKSNDNTVESDAPTDDDEIKSGKCFATVTGGRMVHMLEIRIPLRDNIIKRKLFPYSNMNEPEFIQYNPKGVISIITDVGTHITIEGDDLGRIFDAISSHKLRMIRPANEGEEIDEGEPRPYKITIDDGSEEEGETPSDASPAV